MSSKAPHYLSFLFFLLFANNVVVKPYQRSVVAPLIFLWLVVAAIPRHYYLASLPRVAKPLLVFLCSPQPPSVAPSP
ncbi:hypothetical protein Scep_029551 [Stephania cephalantha]|uniref:Uncharacterized protein n=1 Tax=Stephania cephalantha TaxID=152367 RepID=A0AAP0DXW8_9MAGN